MKFRLSLIGSLVLSACTTETAVRPVSEAGDDQVVLRDSTVFLDGSDSQDSDGSILSWTWTLLSAPSYSTAALVEDPDDPSKVQFQADRDGVYTISLQVRDSDGLDSVPDIVRVTAQRPNERPVAVLEAGGLPLVGGTMVFDGSASFDPEDSPLSYSYELVLSPQDSATSLQDNGGAYAALQLDVEGFYIVGLTVNDGLSDSIRTDVFIDLLNNSNEPPVAICGDPIVVPVGGAGILDGTASADPEGEPLSYSWRLSAKPIGSSAIISDGDKAQARLETDIAGLYRGELTVNDGLYDSAPCEQEVVAEEAEENQAPTADAGGDQTAKPGDTVVLDGTGSSDPDGDPLTATWAFAGLPSMSALTNADITGSETLQASFEPDVEGRYSVRLNLSDGQLTDFDLADVTVADNDPPTADAGSDSTITLGDTAVVDGSGSSDPDGDPLSFLWNFLSVPSGSSITDADLSSVVGQSTSFVPDLAGQYSLRLSVSDGFTSANDVVVVTVSGGSSNNAPTADAGVDQQGSLGDTILLDGTGSSDPDGDPLLYAWSFVTQPTSSVLTDSDITGAFSASASFQPDAEGIYVLGLGVYDGTDYGTDSVIIQIGSTSGNNAPVADAGSDQTAQLGSVVALDASASTDADGDPLSYLWSFDQLPTGSTLTDLDISQSGIATGSFTPDVTGTYVVTVGVTDGKDYDTDSLQVTVSSTSSNTAPVADAGTAQSVLLGDTVSLDASGSSDADGDPLTYAWVFDTQPSTSALVDSDISQGGGATASFTPDAEGTYILLVAVTDGIASDTSTVAITVTSQPGNTAPVADAGANQTVNLGDLVQLDASGSTDADGDALAYEWSFASQPSGSTLVTSDITNPTSVNASFTPDVQGVWNVRARATDGTDYDTDQMVLTVIGTNSPPVADAGSSQTVNLGDSVSLDGSGTSDPDNDPLTYQWLFASIPSTSALTDADISTSTSVSAQFTPDVAGPYTIRLRVTDGIYPANDYLGVVVVSSNTAPTADAGGDQTATTGTLVTLDGSGSSDAEGDVLDYSWALIAPSNSSAALSDPTAEQPTFIADVTGSYVAYLVVNDGQEQSSDVATTTASLASNNGPTADAGLNDALPLGDTASLDGSASSDPDGDPLTYGWTFSRLPATSVLTDADITGANTASPSFTPDVTGSFRLTLQVNDGTTSDSDQVSTTVYPATAANAPPVSDAGNNLLSGLSDSPQLDGTGSYDPDGDPLSYEWTFYGVPSTSSLIDSDIVDADTATPSFSPDVTGAYLLYLVVDDGTDTSYDAVLVRVTNANTPPVADAGSDQSATVGTSVSIDASASTDADADSLSVTWTLSPPLGSTASVQSATSAATSFIPDIAGVYELLLVVSDGTDTDYDFLTVTAQ